MEEWGNHGVPGCQQRHSSIPPLLHSSIAKGHPRPSALIVERLPLAVGTFAIAVGTMVLVGWTFDVDVLKSAGHVITMKPNAAVSLIACGTALVAGSRSAWTLSP